MSLLQRPNSKLAKAKQKGYMIESFNLPAGKTCPGAGACKAFCYAKKGFYAMPSVANRYQQNYDATKDLTSFIDKMNLSVQVLVKRAVKQKLTPVVRIHTAGDFYRPSYFRAWATIVESSPEVIFYAYTKSPFVRKMIRAGKIVLPSNFIIIYSLGSVDDQSIDMSQDRHAKIFDSVEDLLGAGYVDTSDDDTQAFSSLNKKIGLVAH